MELAAPALNEENYPHKLADRWFRVLDRRRIKAGTQFFVARVTGIHSDGRELWVQIARGDSPDRSIVLHLSGWTTLDQAMSAMKAPPTEPQAFPKVVTAIPVA